jgi:hypothetical protein
MLILRLRWQQLGGHIHVRVFTATSFTGTFEKVGDMVFTIEQWLKLTTRPSDSNTFNIGDDCIMQIKHEDEL